MSCEDNIEVSREWLRSIGRFANTISMVLKDCNHHNSAVCCMSLMESIEETLKEVEEAE